MAFSVLGVLATAFAVILASTVTALAGVPPAARVLRLGACRVVVDAQPALVGAIAAALEHGLALVLPSFTRSSAGVDSFDAVYDAAVFASALEAAGVAVLSSSDAAALGAFYTLTGDGGVESWEAFASSGARVADVACSTTAHPSYSSGEAAGDSVDSSRAAQAAATPGIIDRHSAVLLPILAALIPAPALIPHVQAVQAVLRAVLAVGTANARATAIAATATAASANTSDLRKVLSRGERSYDAISLPVSLSRSRWSSTAHLIDMVESMGSGSAPLFIAFEGETVDPALVVSLLSHFPHAVTSADAGGTTASLPPHQAALVDAHVCFGARTWVGSPHFLRWRTLPLPSVAKAVSPPESRRLAACESGVLTKGCALSAGDYVAPPGGCTVAIALVGGEGGGGNCANGGGAATFTAFFFNDGITPFTISALAEGGSGGYSVSGGGGGATAIYQGNSLLAVAGGGGGSPNLCGGPGGGAGAPGGSGNTAQDVYVATGGNGGSQSSGGSGGSGCYSAASLHATAGSGYLSSSIGGNGGNGGLSVNYGLVPGGGGWGSGGNGGYGDQQGYNFNGGGGGGGLYGGGGGCAGQAFCCGGSSGGGGSSFTNTSYPVAYSGFALTAGGSSGTAGAHGSATVLVCAVPTPLSLIAAGMSLADGSSYSCPPGISCRVVLHVIGAGGAMKGGLGADIRAVLWLNDSSPFGASFTVSIGGVATPSPFDVSGGGGAASAVYAGTALLVVAGGGGGGTRASKGGDAGLPSTFSGASGHAGDPCTGGEGANLTAAGAGSSVCSSYYGAKSGSGGGSFSSPGVGGTGACAISYGGYYGGSFTIAGSAPGGRGGLLLFNGGFGCSASVYPVTYAGGGGGGGGFYGGGGGGAFASNCPGTDAGGGGGSSFCNTTSMFLSCSAGAAPQSGTPGWGGGANFTTGSATRGAVIVEAVALYPEDSFPPWHCMASVSGDATTECACFNTTCPPPPPPSTTVALMWSVDVGASCTLSPVLAQSFALVLAGVVGGGVAADGASVYVAGCGVFDAASGNVKTVAASLVLLASPTVVLTKSGSLLTSSFASPPSFLSCCDVEPGAITWLGFNVTAPSGTASSTETGGTFSLAAVVPVAGAPLSPSQPIAVVVLTMPLCIAVLVPPSTLVILRELTPLAIDAPQSIASSSGVLPCSSAWETATLLVASPTIALVLRTAYSYASAADVTGLVLCGITEVVEAVSVADGGTIWQYTLSALSWSASRTRPTHGTDPTLLETSGALFVTRVTAAHTTDLFLLTLGAASVTALTASTGAPAWVYTVSARWSFTQPAPHAADLLLALCPLQGTLLVSSRETLRVLLLDVHSGALIQTTTLVDNFVTRGAFGGVSALHCDTTTSLGYALTTGAVFGLSPSGSQLWWVPTGPARSPWAGLAVYDNTLFVLGGDDVLYAIAPAPAPADWACAAVAGSAPVWASARILPAAHPANTLGAEAVIVPPDACQGASAPAGCGSDGTGKGVVFVGGTPAVLLGTLAELGAQEGPSCSNTTS